MRILGRKRPKQGRETTIDGEILQKLECLLKSKPQSVDIEQLANQLIIAKLFADATDKQAWLLNHCQASNSFKQEANAE